MQPFQQRRSLALDPSLDLQGLAQPDTVITAIQVLYNWVPVVMCGIIFVLLLLFYDIEKKLPAMQSKAEK